MTSKEISPSTLIATMQGYTLESHKTKSNYHPIEERERESEVKKLGCPDWSTHSVTVKLLTNLTRREHGIKVKKLARRFGLPYFKVKH